MLTAREFGLSRYELLGPKRFASLIGPRQALARRLRGRRYSLPEIGRIINRHHTTVWSLLHGGKVK